MSTQLDYKTLQTAATLALKALKEEHHLPGIPENPEWQLIAHEASVTLTFTFEAPTGKPARINVIYALRAGSSQPFIHYYYYPEATYDPNKPVPPLISGSLA